MAIQDSTSYDGILLFVICSSITYSLSFMRKINPTTKNSNKKGSFLLKTPNSLSPAAQFAMKSSSNSSIGGGDHELIKLRDKQVGPNVGVFYKKDGGFVILSGEGCYMKDVDGNKHLDCCNNVAAVGHAHPAVVNAGCSELKKIQTNSRFLNPVQQRYLSKLLSTFPKELNKVYLVNSGSEANDLALRIARSYTKAKCKDDVIVLDVAYHGHTQALVDISPYKWYQAIDGKDYKPKSTHIAPLPDSFRGKYRGGQTEAVGLKYAKDVEEIVKITGGVGAFIAESIVGCGGQIVPPPCFLKKSYEVVRAAGGVCIADEVQTGFARTGNMFASDHEQVIPDLITMAKGMGGGLPVAAVTGRADVMDAVHPGGLGGTYGGNPIALAGALGAIETIEKENLVAAAKHIESVMLPRLQNMAKQHQLIGDVRGRGAMVAIEIVKPRTKIADADTTSKIAKACHAEGVLVLTAGTYGNVLRFLPPLVISDELLNEGLDVLEKAIASAS